MTGTHKWIWWKKKNTHQFICPFSFLYYFVILLHEFKKLVSSRFYHLNLWKLNFDLQDQFKIFILDFCRSRILNKEIFVKAQLFHFTIKCYKINAWFFRAHAWVPPVTVWFDQSNQWLYNYEKKKKYICQ